MAVTRFQQTLCRLIAANRLERGEAREVVATLPARWVGTCVLQRHGGLYTGNLTQLKQDLAADNLVFHAGSVRGAYPQIIG